MRKKINFLEYVKLKALTLSSLLSACIYLIVKRDLLGFLTLSTFDIFSLFDRFDYRKKASEDKEV